MSDLDLRVRALFPGKVNGIDYLLRDDGAGPFLDLWTGPEPEPSDAELAAVTQAAIDAVRAGDADNQAQADVDRKALKAVAAWAADKLGIPRAQARDEIITIYKGL